MLALSILLIFALIVVTIIVIEVRNERKYQAGRRKSGKETESKKEKKKTKSPDAKTEEDVTKKPKSPHKSFQMTRRPKAQQEEEEKPVPKTKKLPTCTYPKFTHVRLVEMGLSDDEAVEFVQELIPQLEAQIPLIEEVMNTSDFHQMERLTHSIKGSATNIGTGGISDLLVECNTYLKSGTDIDIAKAYFEALKHYTQELKDQYT